MIFLAGRKIRFLVGVFVASSRYRLLTWLQVFIKAAWGNRNIQLLCASRALVCFLLPALA